MTDYTPTTEEVVDLWVVYFTHKHDAYMTGIPVETKREEKRAEILRWLAQHDAEKRAEWEAEQGAEEPEGFYVIPNRDAPDQDSLWDGTIHATREAAQASIDSAVREWGQDSENYHVVALVPVEQEGERCE